MNNSVQINFFNIKIKLVKYIDIVLDSFLLRIGMILGKIEKLSLN